MGFSKVLAERCFAQMPAGAEGALVADYWLSLWRGDDLPSRADFSPRAIARQLPATAIFEVVPGISVRCRLFGSGLARAIGQDITGKDWLALTPEADRLLRLERFSGVARGAIGRGLRAAIRESGEVQYSEEIMLPFGEVMPDETRQVLVHIAWRESAYDPTIADIGRAGGLTVEFNLTPLQA
jgi:hypothetical protein